MESTPMTKTYLMLACVSGLSLICALKANDTAYAGNKTLCFEQCTQEAGDRCLSWEKRCLPGEFNQSMARTGEPGLQQSFKQAVAKLDI
jgi:hypothetical protein